MGDFRETIIGCAAIMCRFNVRTSVEPTCSLKMVAIDETGRCMNAEARPVPQPQQQSPKVQAQTAPGHYECGRWVS